MDFSSVNAPAVFKSLRLMYPINSVMITFSPINLPTKVMSSEQTPNNHIKGANTYPNITCKENSLNCPLLILSIHPLSLVIPPNLMSKKLAMAIKAINTSNMEATFTASLSPSTVPFEIESSILLPIFSLVTSTFELMASFCGISILDMITAPGAAMKDAANKCLANFNLSTGSSPPRNAM